MNAGRLGTIVRNPLIGAILSLFLLQGCVMKVWRSPDEPTTYSSYGNDGRAFIVVLMPNNEAVYLYTEEEGNFFEAVKVKMVGTYGTNYFWRLWSIDGPSANLFKYRIYPEGATPVAMETTVLTKSFHGKEASTFLNIGEKAHPVMLFKGDKIKFQDMWLTKENADPQSFLRMLKSLNI